MSWKHYKNNVTQHHSLGQHQQSCFVIRASCPLRASAASSCRRTSDRSRHSVWQREALTTRCGPSVQTFVQRALQHLPATLLSHTRDLTHTHTHTINSPQPNTINSALTFSACATQTPFITTVSCSLFQLHNSPYRNEKASRETNKPHILQTRINSLTVSAFYAIASVDLVTSYVLSNG